jgi:hypothetical protein
MSKRGGIFGLGMSLSQEKADGLYVKQFVDATHAAETYDATMQGGATETVLGTFTGPVFARIPKTAAPALLGVSGGVLAHTFVRVMHAQQPGFMSVARYNGTIAAPTGTLASQVVGEYVAHGFLADASGFARVASIQALTINATTGTDQSGIWRLQTKPGGSTTFATVVDVQTPTSVIAEIVYRQATGRLRPNTGGILQLRNPLNTASVVETGTDDLGFYGVARVTRQTVTGSRGGNAALASLLTALAATGIVIDSTTA